MRILNKTFSPTAKVRRKRALLHSFATHDDLFIIDRNSLATAEITRTEADAAHNSLEKGLLFNCPYQPTETRVEQKPRFLILNLTERCNLRCKYCFVPIEKRDARSGGTTMRMETVLQAFSFLDTPTPEIGFFGGEPLLVGANYLTWIMENAERQFQTPRFHLTTNGTLITDEIANALAEHHVSVILSLDGADSIHNHSRPDSWKETITGLRILKDAGVKPITGRATFTPENMRLEERVTFLSGLIKIGMLDSLSIEAAALRPEQKWSWKMLCAEWEKMSIYLSQNTEVLDKFGTLQTLIKRVRDGAPQVRNCGAGNGYITVAVDGTIHACHREASPIGNVQSGFDSRRKLWINPAEPTECSVCWARYLCGSGCHASRRFEMHAQQCSPNKIQAMQAIWLLSKRG